MKLLSPADVVAHLTKLRAGLDSFGAEIVKMSEAIEATVEDAAKGGRNGVPIEFAKDLAPVRLAAFVSQQIRTTALSMDMTIEAAKALSVSMAERAAQTPRPKKRDFMNEAEHAEALRGWKRLRDDVRAARKAARKERS